MLRVFANPANIINAGHSLILFIRSDKINSLAENIILQTIHYDYFEYLLNDCFVCSKTAGCYDLRVKYVITAWRPNNKKNFVHS
jgi:hypothetical protein